MIVLDIYIWTCLARIRLSISHELLVRNCDYGEPVHVSQLRHPNILHVASKHIIVIM
jgi:hypothetical protein